MKRYAFDALEPRPKALKLEDIARLRGNYAKLDPTDEYLRRYHVVLDLDANTLLDKVLYKNPAKYLDAAKAQAIELGRYFVGRPKLSLLYVVVDVDHEAETFAVVVLQDARPGCISGGVDPVQLSEPRLLASLKTQLRATADLMLVPTTPTTAPVATTPDVVKPKPAAPPTVGPDLDM
jgi:hypothetical protein